MSSLVEVNDKENMDMQIKHDQLSKEIERLNNLLKQSERKRRKQKVVYEKNMENLSIKLAEFEKNLRREQKEIKDTIDKKDKQIKVREELTRLIREKLEQQHCSQCGHPNSFKAFPELDWQLESDEESQEAIKTLPPLDLPPPDITANIGFTNHRPFRPKSKLSPVAEESESTFASSLRNIHADLNPNRFHAALTASLNFLQEDDGVEIPANYLSEQSEQSSRSPTNDSNIYDMTDNSEMADKSDKAINPPAAILSSFCETLSLNTMKLVNNNLLKESPRDKTKSLQLKSDTTAHLESFCFRVVRDSFLNAKLELARNSMKIKDQNLTANKSTTLKIKKTENRDERLRLAAVKVVDTFLTNDLTYTLICESVKKKDAINDVGDYPEVSNSDVASANDAHLIDSSSTSDFKKKREVSKKIPFHTTDPPNQYDQLYVGTPESSIERNSSMIVDSTTELTQQRESSVAKKKKKKKKKKRKSLETPIENGKSVSEDFNRHLATSECERTKSPAEDKYSLLLEERLDFLDELETNTSNSAEVTRM